MLISASLALFLAASSRGADWLADARRAAAATSSGEGESGAGSTYTAPSRLFTCSLPGDDWTAIEEDDGLGGVVRLFGPEDASGLLRATISVRLFDRDRPGFRPVKDAVDAMRRDAPDRESTAVRTQRLPAGLARLFEVWTTRRLPADEPPSASVDVHQYVAVIPRGESYWVVRLISAKADAPDLKSVFVAFLGSLRPAGPR